MRIDPPVQEHIYKILVVVDRLCENHNIPYFFIGGTAIGALRHQGFIPWDDDIDIGMLRPDFKRFIKVSVKNLPDGYKLHHYTTDRKINFDIAKIIDSHIWVQAPYNENQFYRVNVCLDVFPLDNVPINKLKRRIQLAGLKFIKALLEVKYFNHSKPRWRNRMLVRFVRPVLPCGGTLVKIYTCLAAWEKSNIVPDVWQANSQYQLDRTIYLRDWVARRRRAVFEHGEFWIPAEAELCMERTYGDYMTPPPPEKRVAHDFVLITEHNPV